MNDSVDSFELVRRAADGDHAALDELFTRYRGRLRRMVQLRLNRRLSARVDPSDVIQDAYLQASKALTDYLKEPRLPPFLWLRQLTGQQLLAVHRHHLGTHARDAAREVPIHRARSPEADTTSMAVQLLDRTSTPAAQAARVEQETRLQEGLEAMQSADREIIALRHFEGLSNVEAAQVLALSESAASSRFFRALRRLTRLLGELGVEDT